MKHFDMNLQLFAEPEAPATEQEQPETTPTTEPEKTYTQSDLDRIIAQRISRERRDIESQLKQARAEGRTEAEKLAKMTEEQRIQHEREQAETAANERAEALAQKEAELTRRELRANALDILREKKLSPSLADILDYTDADSVQKSMETVEKIVRDAVQKGIDERLNASRSPLMRAGKSGASDLGQQVRAAMGLKTT